MAEQPRKVPFVTISSFGGAPQTPELNKKRRREDEAIDRTLGKDGGGSAAALGSGGGGDPFGNRKGGESDVEEAKPTVRLSLTLTEPNERTSAEFNYGELVKSTPTATTASTTTQVSRCVVALCFAWVEREVSVVDFFLSAASRDPCHDEIEPLFHCDMFYTCTMTTSHFLHAASIQSTSSCYLEAVKVVS